MAEWLYDNTELSYCQIASICHLSLIEVENIASGRNTSSYKLLNPVEMGAITQAEINLLVANPDLTPITTCDDKTAYSLLAVTDCQNENVTEIQLAKLYHATYGRNAWHSTWITEYDELIAYRGFSLTLPAAKRGLESNRVQGTHMTIREHPAISFVCENSTIIIAELDRYNPLKKINADDVPLNLKGLASYFEPSAVRRYLRFFIKKRIRLDELDCNLGLMNHESFSEGTKYGLAYSEHPNDEMIIESLVKNLSRLRERLSVGMEE